MVVLALLTGAASAQVHPPLIPSWEKARSVHIDTWSFGQAFDPWGSDWSSTLMEQWTAVLDCKPVAKRTESCTFHDGVVHWGYVKEGTEEVKYVTIEMPAELEFVWNVRGRLSRWDVRGDRERFWAQASNAFLKALFHRSDVVFKPDSQREIGTEIEQRLCRKLAGAVELDLPKNGESIKGQWVTTKPLWAGRRYTMGSATAKVGWRVEEMEGDVATIAWNGSISEASTTMSHSVQTKLMGQARLDTSTGGLSHVYTESAAVSSGNVALADHTRFMSFARPFDGGEITPQAMPQPKITIEKR